MVGRRGRGPLVPPYSTAVTAWYNVTMARKLSCVAAGWWDYTTLDDELLADAAKLSAAQLLGLSRPGFRVVVYDTLEDFYLAEALEYITAWQQSTADNPVGICGPIGRRSNCRWWPAW